MVAGAGTRLDVPPHVQLDLLPADTPARRHHCIAHAVTAGAIHPGIGLVQVSATGVVVSEAARAPGIRGVSHAGLGTLLVSQPGLGPMEARRYILRARFRCKLGAPSSGELLRGMEVWKGSRFDVVPGIIEGVKNQGGGYSNERILIKQVKDLFCRNLEF